jgi:hypothetical protein
MAPNLRIIIREIMNLSIRSAIPIINGSGQYQFLEI